MSAEWEALIGDDFMMRGLRIAWRRDLHDSGTEYSNGSVNWVERGDGATVPNIDPLILRDDMARALLAALLRHYNGADDARMLRKDYDAERARVDRLTETVSVIARAGR